MNHGHSTTGGSHFGGTNPNVYTRSTKHTPAHVSKVWIVGTSGCGGGWKKEMESATSLIRKASKTTRSSGAYAMLGFAQRNTKALYKIIDTVLTFLSRCWIDWIWCAQCERKFKKNYKPFQPNFPSCISNIKLKTWNKQIINYFFWKTLFYLY